MEKILCRLRAVFLAFFVVFHTLFCSIVVIVLLLTRAPRSWVDAVIGPFWCGLMVRFSGMKPVINGLENVPKERGFLYLFTHSSHLDIPLLFTVSPKSFRFGAKSSLFKIPIFGYAITLSGTLPITREDRKKVMEVYRQAEARVAAGEAFALAPEGGRRQGTEIKDFKSGPFIFAINAKMPIVPVVLSGVDDALPKKSLLINRDCWSRKVGVTFLPPIDTKDVPIEDMKKLKAEVRERMVMEFERMKPLYMNMDSHQDRSPGQQP